MRTSTRSSLFLLLLSSVVARIDREALVRRHTVRVTALDASSPLSVGNGEFAFTADTTGLQTLNETFTEPPLQTMTHWGWHTIPAKLAGVEPSSFSEQSFVINGHTSHYPTGVNQSQPLVDYLRSNPHRLNLGRIFLRRGAASAAAGDIAVGDITHINQTLDLWTGTLFSSFVLDGARVDVTTAAHPTLDTVAVRVCSPLLATHALAIGVAFPYGSSEFKGGSDWSRPSRHTSEIITTSGGAVPVLRHSLDATAYFMHARLNASGGAAVGLTADGVPHAFIVAPRASTSPVCLDANFLVSPRLQSTPPPTAAETFQACASHWPAVWQSGAALDLSGSTAAGAHELERRLVLSQYIMLSQEAGTNPPQETGLMLNSWYGKFHLEMRWHHQAHFFLWNRAAHAQRCDGYFERVHDLAAKHTREQQGYNGVRWPKMAGPPEAMVFEGGYTLYEGPSGAGPFLVWNQPHLLTFAEMAYRVDPSAATLARYNQSVHETADFMASFILAAPIGPSGCRSLGPPVWTAEIENNGDVPVEQTSDPTFELAYWRHGFSLAARWRARQGLPPQPVWVKASSTMCRPTPRFYPAADADVYYPYARSTVFAPGTYATQLFAAVLAPPTLSNVTVLQATMRQAIEELGVTNLPWCSDFAQYAMAAGRLGMRQLAAELLVQPNTSAGSAAYLSSGQCRMGSFLPVYTPGNGALLSAAAMLLGGGWDGDDGRPLPGMPRDGSWRVQAEGFVKAL